jgi:iron complex transport system substrate-binding protein
MRIVSLVPAGTDIVRALGLDAALVGISHECDAPGAIAAARLTRGMVATDSMRSAEIDAAVAERAASGAPMYQLDIERLLALAPDLVISQSLCDVCALPAHAVERVLADAAPHVPLLSLDGRSVQGMLQSIEAIGECTDRVTSARAVIAALRERLERVANAVRGLERERVVSLEWLDPPYACGHWIPEMIERAGGVDPLGKPGTPSVRVQWTDIERARPRTVIAMPCGYDLARAKADVACMSVREEWRQAIGDARVVAAAGGAYFTRPGPQLVTGIEVLAAILHPEVVHWDVPAGAVAG